MQTICNGFLFLLYNYWDFSILSSSLTKNLKKTRNIQSNLDWIHPPKNIYFFLPSVSTVRGKSLCGHTHLALWFAVNQQGTFTAHSAIYASAPDYLGSKQKYVVTGDALTTRLLISVAFVRRCVEEHDGEDVQVPHAIDSSEEGAVHLHCVLSPVPVALIHLCSDTRQIQALIVTLRAQH